MSKRRRNLQRNMALGAFLLLCLGTLTVLTFRLGALTLKEQVTWTAYFGVDSTVKKDADVYVAGTRVGRVVAVRLLPDEELAPGRYVKVELSVRKDLRIWEDASVIMQSRGLLGRSVLELDRGTPGKRALTPETPLPGRMAGDPFDSLNGLIDENRANISQITSDLAEVTGRIRRAEGTVGRLLGDEELYRKIEGIVDDVRSITSAAASEETTLGRLIRDRTLYDRLLSGVTNLEEITGQIRSGKGLVGQLIYDEGVAKDARELIAHARGIARALDAGEGTLGKLLHDPSLHDAALDGVRAIRAIAVRLEGGEGSLGRLLADDGRIYANIEALTDNLRAVSEDVRAGRGSLGLLLKDETLYREAQRMIESFRETGEVARENAPLASLISFTSLFFNVLN
jgi:phospholipid/cholesterol/gamma-HCH transport system substrate-binding protein